MAARKPPAKGKPSPTHKPTDKTRAEVSALSSFGIPQTEIAGYMELDPKSLRKHYRHELDYSMMKANAKVAQFLFRGASGASIPEGASYSDCYRAAMFWLKTRAKWRETGEDDQAQNPFDNLTIEIVRATKATADAQD